MKQTGIETTVLSLMLLLANGLTAQPVDPSLVITRFSDGHVFQQYQTLKTTVVDTVLTSSIDHPQQMTITSSRKVCPDGSYQRFDESGFLVLEGTLQYTYGSSCRTGEWKFYLRGKLIRTERYVDPGHAYYLEDPGCITID